ncbi:hypothetical protein BJ138DRAFT_1166083 [Hygrophoropsis aurantiaca]|uniref:Uncharacterized protein n=1 Tax=Hygrophoropsis aurantiaca TaxID=72124 RepID=A0ACB7ZV20_9AGAM|nr:hypothetical protein BJ138DRAFT_1166083 [Hygrophoropsis aurantiaca]
MSIIILNYVSAPFMLLTFTDSMQAWRRLDWYGFWIIGSALVFFYSGGSKALKTLRKEEPKAPDSRPQTPGPHVLPPFDSAADEFKRRINEQQ